MFSITKRDKEVTIPLTFSECMFANVNLTDIDFDDDKEVEVPLKLLITNFAIREPEKTCTMVFQDPSQKVSNLFKKRFDKKTKLKFSYSMDGRPEVSAVIKGIVTVNSLMFPNMFASVTFSLSTYDIQKVISG